MVTGRYLTVGFTCALLHNAIVIAGDRAGLHYAVSSLISFAIVVVVGYRLHSSWTFPGAVRSGMSFARYTVMASANYPLTVGGLFVFVDLLGVSVPVASPIVTVLLTVVNFFGNRWALLVRRGASMIPVPGRVTIIGRPPCPDWLRSDDEIIGTLAAHQSVYRFRRPRYQLQLLKDLATMLPPRDCRMLDIGAGSGLVAEIIASTFPGKTVEAVDVTNRILPTVRVPFRTFDGRMLPFEDGSFDCALLANVLHHVKIDERRGLLTEALRVTGGGPIVIKDHLAGSRLDHVRLACLDFIGNAPFGGMVSADYLGPAEWTALLDDVKCTGEILTNSPYRGALSGVIFPNRLEICLRITTDAFPTPAASVSLPRAD